MREILERLARGEISVDEAERLLRVAAIEEVGALAKLDLGRQARTGIPEVILAEGKEAQDVASMVLAALKKIDRILVSRVSREHVEAIREHLPDDADIDFHERARMVVVRRRGSKVRETGGRVGVITAGTSDIPVAEEARVVAEEMGCRVYTAYDVGVAGIHRLFPSLREMVERDVDVLVVVAGREGALPTIVAGLVDIPIIAVPTSMGYGLGEGGVSALTAMLQSCSLGLAVVNIDAGVAAGAVAALIANRMARARESR